MQHCKFGSDKPNDNTLRLTLLYTPGVRNNYMDQATQDWGRHDIVYGLYGHEGDWRQGQSEWQARRLNQPLVAFEVRIARWQTGKGIFAAVRQYAAGGCARDQEGRTF